MGSGLTLDMFFGAEHDIEKTQYRFLSELKTIREAFSANIIYPHLSSLVSVYEGMTALKSNMDGVRDSMPGDASHIDPETLSIVYDNKYLKDDHMAGLEEIITWAIPYIQNTIEEGKTIYEFVEQNMTIEEVGIIPAYVEEGYALVPDKKYHKLHVLRYRLSIFSGKDEDFRSLRTTHVRALESGEIELDPTSVKLGLVQDIRELPNPATFSFATDLDFPYESTLLPIAKRKLIRHLYKQTGDA